MKKLSSILMFTTCPFSGFYILAAILSGYWYLCFLIIAILYLIIKFYVYAHKDEFAKQTEKWEEFKKNHTYVGTDRYYTETWRNNKTGELIEIEG